MPTKHETYYQQFIETNPYPRNIKSYAGDSDTIINFSSNDYLGLAKHPLLITRSQEYAKNYGTGATSSRLVVGNLDVFNQLEEKLAKSIGKPKALILGSGYQTNISVLEALLDAKILGQEPLVFCDRLCHISMLATTQYLTRLQRFQHNDLDHLQILLEKHQESTQPKFILVESIYSMDGDQTDFEKLIPLAKKHHAFLYVDDAHSVGIYGPAGFGKAAHYAKDIDIIMGTFSKALGSFGGYIACSETVRCYLINKCKGLIYSTGSSPAVLGAIDAAIELLPQLTQARERLLTNASKLRDFFQQEKLDYGNATTHIIPWIIGDAEKTLQISQLLEEQGILAATIRPPSVPVGKSRIRFCLSAEHKDEHFEKLFSAIRKIIKLTEKRCAPVSL